MLALGRLAKTAYAFTTLATAFSKRAIPSRISASGITRDGVKRTTSAPATNDIRPCSVPATKNSLARPLYCSFTTAPINKPLPRISLNTLYFSLTALSSSLNNAAFSFTPASTSGVFTVSNAASATAHASGLPP